MPELSHAEEGQQPERRRQNRGGALRDEENGASRIAINDRSCDRANQQRGAKLERAGDAQRQRITRGKGEPEPLLRGALHKGSRDRDDLSPPEQAIIAKTQRRKRAVALRIGGAPAGS